jgi:TRAP-type C4-dicarboxylate transport system permease small subunit
MARFDRWLTALEKALLGSAILGASLILFANVILRYFFAKGLVWAEELVRYLIIWMVFVGGAVAARQSNHINVDVLVNLLPDKPRLLVLRVLRVLAALFCVALCVWGARLAEPGGDRLGVAVHAAGADAGATPKGVPCLVCPLDLGITHVVRCLLVAG